jgi:hypothetical protein
MVEKSSHHALSPDDASVAPPFQGAGVISKMVFVDCASTSAYFAAGVYGDLLSNPVTGLLATAIFSLTVKYPN